MIDNIFDELAAPFPPTQVSWRVGSINGDKTKGLALAYIDARDVMDRLDTVAGPGNWQVRYPFAGCCEIGLRDPNTGGWVWKSNGAGVTDVEAEKGQFSDAFKRAAVLWGIGRYLYHLKSPWVALKPFGRSFAIADEAQAELLELLNKPQCWRNARERTKASTEIQRLWGANNAEGLLKFVSTLDNDQQIDLWRDFNSTQRSEMKTMLAQARANQEKAA